MHLATRFVQLDATIKLELWQEAFRTVEDIHVLMTASTRPLPPAMMASYYASLAKIFWVSESYLCHAAACLKLFAISGRGADAKA